MDADLELSVSLLADGFTALCDEYKTLAAQHQSLERHLAQSKEECDRLRTLCPEKAQAQPTLQTFSSENRVKTSLPLAEWLDNISGASRRDISESISRIKQAETASLQIKNRLNSKGGCPFNAAPKRPPPPSLSKTYFAATGHLPDIEEDFTTPGAAPGQLGCPFAGTNFGTPNAGKDQLPPTPRSSRSRISSKPRSRLSSFHDPLNPSVIISAEGSRMSSKAPSIAASGPACPIRFLGQHKPEDIAKYFQEHKHELPRSHEVCVKRFGTDSEDVKKLDAKYGDLVNMIQGLGQKHRPMLPANPILPGDDEDYDEENQKEKISMWARAISEDAVMDGVDGVGSNTPTHQRGNSDPTGATGGEERVSHFDRPLRDVRVGESPSRPWGVPIPLKYLEREDEIQDEPTPAPAAAPTAKEVEGLKMERRDAKPADAKPVDSKPAGKCPFDHKAMAAMAGGGTQKHAEHPEVPNVKGRPDNSTDVQPKKSMPEPTMATQVIRSSGPQQHTGGRGQNVTNNGFMVVGDESRLKGIHVVNNGTLVLGLDIESVKSLMQTK